MQPYHFILLVAGLGTLAGCSHASHPSTAASANASPSPLRQCETREIVLDGTDMLLQANVNGTLGSITIVHAPDRDAQDRALEDARKNFGAPHPDTRTTTHQSKWGILELTDPCGRPVSPSAPAPSPTAS